MEAEIYRDGQRRPSKRKSNLAHGKKKRGNSRNLLTRKMLLLCKDKGMRFHRKLFGNMSLIYSKTRPYCDNKSL
jgi:hypothetical protein